MKQRTKEKNLELNSAVVSFTQAEIFEWNYYAFRKEKRFLCRYHLKI